MISKRLQGLSLVELMVALAISSILMGGVLYVFNSGKRTYTLQTDLAELQDNARFVMDELTRDIRMAGYFGCAGNPPRNPPLPTLQLQPFYSKDAMEKELNDIALTDEMGNSFPATDTLRIAFFAGQLGVDFEKTDFGSGNNDIFLAPGSGGANSVIVSDCKYSHSYNVEKFTPASSTEPNPKITIGPSPSGFLVDGYERPVEVFAGLTPVTYQVDSIQGGGFGLYKFNGNVHDDDDLLIEGVQNMQVRYGVDTDNVPPYVPNRYSTNPDEGRVVSVRITLLMRTAKKRGFTCPYDKNKRFFLDPDIDTYSPMDNKNKNKEDGYCHRLFTSTIHVRNGSDQIRANF